MLKDSSIIKKLPDDSPHVVADGILQHCMSRPQQLNETCLADFVSLYKRVKPTSRTDVSKNEYNSDEEKRM